MLAVFLPLLVPRSSQVEVKEFKMIECVLFNLRSNPGI